MEVRLQSGKLIIVEDGRLDEIWKLGGFLTEGEMEELEEAVILFQTMQKGTRDAGSGVFPPW